ncbi:MAG: GspE/PulE family protein, partial [Cyanobacteria bacterium REEB65]|nr:GspE/PulE family protein [Cyanobacteria bacterium REEB65]
RRPQDGRFTVKARSGDQIDFRASCINTHWGEKLCLRLLRPLAVKTGIEHLGFGENDQERFLRLLASPAGVILVTGPTGSGKTSTLYAALGMMDRATESIITIEDPVEFPFPGICQIQVNPKIDLTFASALRTILRQDPDTIMLGEIRDHETLETAVHAAMTGHLVLSTIHTNDAVSTVNRMVEMGIQPYMVSSTIAGIIAQRLVRRICPRCKVEFEASPEEKEFLRANPDEPLLLSKGEGCDHCNETGYKGQLGIFEVLLMNKKLQDLINKGESVLALADAARQSGMSTMLEDGKRKVIRKLTTIAEVTRICGYGGDD